MNTKLLKSKMVAYGDTQESLADALGISRTRLTSKINGVSDFRQMEMIFIKERYGLSADDIDDIFLDQKYLKKIL